MKPLTPKSVPCTAADCADKGEFKGWATRVREAIARDGQAVRLTGPTIEAKNLWNNEWQPIMLPGGGILFASEEDAKAVFEQLHKEPAL